MYRGTSFLLVSLGEGFGVKVGGGGWFPENEGKGKGWGERGSGACKSMRTRFVKTTL